MPQKCDQHRKEVLRINDKGREVFRCTHIRNIKAEAILEACGTCGKKDKVWVCESCPGYDREARKFIYRLEVPKCPPWEPWKIATRPIRVAFETQEFYLGGAEIWIAALCREFDRSRIKPTVVAVNNWHARSEIAMAAMPGDVPVMPLEAVALNWSAFADVLIHWGKAPIDCKLPTISCIHHSGADRRLRKAALKAIAAGAQLVGVNEVCRMAIPEKHRDEMIVLPNGADQSRLQTCGRTESRAALGIAPRRKVVAHIGRVMEDKDVPALCRAVGELPEEWLAIVCGTHDGSTPIAAMKAMAKQRMIYLPAKGQIGDVLAAADVFALLSPSEAHPLAVTEAWLAGVPVVCTDLPWLESIEAQHGPMAVKVDRKHDSKEVAAAIESAYGLNVAKIQRIAQEHFTAAAMARRWERYFLGEE
jgi:glycosyltransferase involved in cell wall biosynthesis